MTTSTYLKVSGKNQGAIEGPVTRFSREGSIEVYGWNHEITSPRDTATGKASGRRKHSPLTIIKGLDQSSVKFYQAMVANEPFSSWVLECWGLSPLTGEEEHVYTIELINAVISGIVSEQPLAIASSNETSSVREQISFMYQGISWKWEANGSVAEDSQGGR